MAPSYIVVFCTKPTIHHFSGLRSLFSGSFLSLRPIVKTELRVPAHPDAYISFRGGRTSATSFRSSFILDDSTPKVSWTETIADLLPFNVRREGTRTASPGLLLHGLCRCQCLSNLLTRLYFYISIHYSIVEINLY